MISSKEVKKIAALSYIELKEEELKKYTRELSRVIDFFEILKRIDTGNVEPLLETTELEDVLSEDKSKPCPLARKLIDQAPQKKGSYFKTKPILE